MRCNFMNSSQLMSALPVWQNLHRQPAECLNDERLGGLPFRQCAHLLSSRSAGILICTEVYIPIDTNATSALPVLVYFHGGGFEGGSSRDAPPENILQGSASPLIFVTFKYRLGQFGFLGGNAVKAHGALNAGLLDQVRGRHLFL